MWQPVHVLWLAILLQYLLLTQRPRKHYRHVMPYSQTEMGKLRYVWHVGCLPCSPVFITQSLSNIATIETSESILEDRGVHFAITEWKEPHFPGFKVLLTNLLTSWQQGVNCKLFFSDCRFFGKMFCSEFVYMVPGTTVCLVVLGSVMLYIKNNSVHFLCWRE